MLWSKQNKKVAIVDYEFAQFGHPAVDIAYFFVHLGSRISNEFGDSFIKRYCETLLKSGKLSDT